MSEKHTPGPWEIGKLVAGERYGVNFIYSTGPVVCAVSGFPTNATMAETLRDIKESPELAVPLANAKLIAAAPELLEASKRLLCEALSYLEDSGDCDHSVNICCCELKRRIDFAKAAIAKATD